MTENNAAPHIILYIEDNAANRQLVELIIERRDDLSLILAENGRSGLQAAEAQLPDLILLDNSLPDMDGLEVLAMLRDNEKTRAIPVVSLSGNHLLRQDAAGSPAFDGYLAKPIDIEKFYAAIDQYLGL